MPAEGSGIRRGELRDLVHVDRRAGIKRPRALVIDLTASDDEQESPSNNQTDDNDIASDFATLAIERDVALGLLLPCARAPCALRS